MYLRMLMPLYRIALIVATAAAFLCSSTSLAQANLRATSVGKNSITVKWSPVPGATGYSTYIEKPKGANVWNQGKKTSPSVTTVTFTGLKANTRYGIYIVQFGRNDGVEITVRTKGNGNGSSKKSEKPSYTPPPVTCPHLPSDRAVVSGYKENTRCQMVGEVVIAKQPALVERGFIDAVDVWNYVNGGLEVCFRSDGWLVFLDATYLQRMAMELEQYQRDGMTCGKIDRIGTVVLLESAAGVTTPTSDETPATLPTFDSIPLSDCQIKLETTLFLRAEPAGEIIGLVWLNSEVPAFEINGYWYKVEFEGKRGYISRYHRRVLRGGCG